MVKEEKRAIGVYIDFFSLGTFIDYTVETLDDEDDNILLFLIISPIVM